MDDTPYAWSYSEDFTLWSDEKLHKFLADIDATYKQARRWLGQWYSPVLAQHCKQARIAPATEVSIRSALLFLAGE